MYVPSAVGAVLVGPYVVGLTPVYVFVIVPFEPVVDKDGVRVAPVYGRLVLPETATEELAFTIVNAYGADVPVP